MKKLLFFFAFTLIGVLSLSQMNYEQAVGKASQVDTDGEIQSVLAQHGFECDIYDHIGIDDKLVALVNVLGE